MGKANAEFQRLWALSGWRQAQVARELGVSTATVSRYASGEIEPSTPVLRLLADRLNVPLIIDGEDYRPNSLRDGPRWLQDWEVEVITALRRIEQPDRERVIRAMKELAAVIVSAQARTKTRRPTGYRRDDPLPGLVETIEEAADRLKDASPPSPAPPMFGVTAVPISGHPQRTDDAPSPPPSLPLPGPTKRQRSVGKHPAP